MTVSANYPPGTKPAEAPASSRMDAIPAAAEVAAETDDTPQTEFTLSTGVILGLRSVPPMLVRRAVLQVSSQAPVPPKIFIEHQDREEANPNDPAYLAAVERHGETEFMAAAAVILGVGTWVISIPAMMPGPDSDAWIEEADFFHVEAEVNCWRCKEEIAASHFAKDGCKACEKARYISWLNLCAIASESEWLKLMVTVAKRTGVSEGEVQAALSSFRRGTLGGTNSGVPLEDSRNGNHVPEAPPVPGS